MHDLTARPTDYWRSWKKTANVMRLQVRQPNTAAPEDKVRIGPSSPHLSANSGMFSCGSCACLTLTPSPLTSTFRYLTAMFSSTQEISPGQDVQPRSGSSIAGWERWASHRRGHRPDRQILTFKLFPAPTQTQDCHRRKPRAVLRPFARQKKTVRSVGSSREQPGQPQHQAGGRRSTADGPRQLR